MKHSLIALLLLSSTAVAQTYPTPTLQGANILGDPANANGVVRKSYLDSRLAAATATTAGTVICGTTLVCTNGVANVVTQTPAMLSGNVLATDVFLIQRDTTVYYASPSQVPASLLAGSSASSSAGSSTTQAAATATTYTAALSSTSGTTGTAVTYTLTPGSGGWPAVAVTPASTVAGSFSPTSTTPTAGSTAALAFAYTPTAAGTASLTATASGMTNSTGARAYTVTAAAVAAQTFGTGKFAQAMTGGSVSLPVNFAAGGTRSFQFWYKAASAPSDVARPLITMSDGSSVGITGVSGSVVTADVGSTALGSNSNATASDGTWHWITAVLAGSNGQWSVWMDGSLVLCCGGTASVGAVTSISVTAQDGVGIYNGGNTKGWGQIDDLRIGTSEPSDKSPPTAAATILPGTTVYHLDGGVSAASN